MRHASPSRIIAISFGALFTGCAPMGYKITPVPVDKSLEEKVLIDEKGWSPAKIVLIDVDGIIMNNRKPSLFGEGEHPVSLFTEKLDKAGEDKSVKGMIIRINSPGGSVTASDIMYNELMQFKARTNGKVPVVAVMMDVAASGGYYIACATDEIVAHPTTVTGSIGVIMQMVRITGTLDKIGVETEAIKSGKMKDAGSPFRELKPEERELFQKLVMEFYDRFVMVVAKGRPGMGEAKVREVADGRVYSAQQALELGFIDRIGTLRDTLACVKEKIGAERVRVVTYQRPFGWKPNIYAEQPANPAQINLFNLEVGAEWLTPQPQFMYLWAPGS